MSERDPGPSPRQQPRPRRVTMAGVMAAVACVLVIVALFDTMAAVHSSETPESYRGVLRGLVLTSGALAAAGAVLAVYALRRHRGARLGLTVTSGLLLATSLALADPIPVLVAVGAAMLWSQEARDWFDGRPPQAERTGSAPPEDDLPPSSQYWPPPAPGSRSDPSPPPAAGIDRPGEPPANPYAGPSSNPYAGPPANPYADPTRPLYAGPATWHPAAPRTSSRPSSVTVAAWLTWVFCSLSTFAFLIVVAEVLAARDQLLDALHSNPALPATWDDRDVLAALWIASAVGIFWSLAAIALAVLAFRRVQIARVTLVVSAVLAGLVGGVTIVGLLNAAAAVTVVVLLFTGRANAWYAGRTHPPGPPRPPGAPGPPQERPPDRRADQPQERPPVW